MSSKDNLYNAEYMFHWVAAGILEYNEPVLKVMQDYLDMIKKHAASLETSNRTMPVAVEKKYIQVGNTTMEAAEVDNRYPNKKRIINNISDSIDRDIATLKKQEQAAKDEEFNRIYQELIIQHRKTLNDLKDS